MGLDRVVLEIERNAENEAKRIIKEGEVERKRILEEAQGMVRQAEKEITGEMEAEIKRLRTKNLMVGKFCIKTMTLNAKKEMIEKVYSDFFERLNKAGKAEKAKLFKRLFSFAEKQMDKPKVVYVSKSDLPFAKRLFKRLHIHTAEMKGGFILENQDGKESVDMRFKTLAELLKGRTLKDVSKMLFGG